ncbi:hypothetical protein A2715_05550 [Candidatus Woesebacteria bacterium RIFCSPHIGHO2_01_FULL_39_32]|uniref:IMP dehydrogenase/GMP reductase domain-containing protein n=1 Tax=Candidatus Woesebacteria bacterium RIFCSPLOWO2_01_FULL_39_25 TaxID=1802521 RepID=A0A1F8BLT4_9BACT|nr:MAG: hypothetical protein A2715_05550 [Candidatus Woesebacteria bacterium RIFCSPHIGHO2_01_FULL_39_32]OGM38742.1 MAG: hypothetical protein A3F01_06210 [Candidatus Woesebacteria bacterium RIFCSPHIGHO2_12_FULL_38_11]OGM65016.1 MAG: hypothetical protein A2893_05160 [Candidatus Woesebacteria bacterium RIFCSPLOWO2_01_FULL_39_25]
MPKTKAINYSVAEIKGKKVKTPIYQLNEPYSEEMQRIRFNELSSAGVNFAYSLETLAENTPKTRKLKANHYRPIIKTQSDFYSRYRFSVDSPSIGVVLTNIDFGRIQRNGNGEPVFFQMGPARRTLALAQRALFFDDNHNENIYTEIEKLERGKLKIPSRSNRRSPTIEEALGIKGPGKPALYTPAISELGYKKISSYKLLSRREIVGTGLFNIVGKYPRKIIGLGAMPPISGWIDTLVMSAIGHMISFIPRSSVFALNFEDRIKLAKKTRDIIDGLQIETGWKEKVFRNVGAALGAENPKEELKMAIRLHNEAGISVFRIYTIGSDPRVIQTAKLLRQKFGREVEIFVGQVADKNQSERLVTPDIAVDGLIFGHGGGQQCTSAINGMAITTLEDVYELTLDRKFNNTSILLEGGVGRSIGTALIIGVDAVLGNQKFVRGTIETGDLFVLNNKDKICQPYPGTASPVTQIIESEDGQLRVKRTDAAGRTYYTEGKPGLMYYEAKACSMAFWINEYLRHAARTLADLGVENIFELRTFLSKDKREFLRIMSEKTQYLSEAHGNFNT